MANATKLGPGRPPKLTKAITAVIVDGINRGSFPLVAARRAGIGDSTYYLWMQKGRAGAGKRYVEFLDAVVRALANLETILANRVLADARGDVGSAKWYLQNGPPKERWNAKTEIEVHGKDGSPIEAQVTHRIVWDIGHDDDETPPPPGTGNGADHDVGADHAADGKGNGVAP